MNFLRKTTKLPILLMSYGRRCLISAMKEQLGTQRIAQKDFCVFRLRQEQFTLTLQSLKQPPLKDKTK